MKMNKDTNLCVICGDTKEHPLSPFYMKYAPYIYKKQSFPHQVVTKCFLKNLRVSRADFN